MTMASKTVSLVLGSGGARGLAHIGIIEWLEENDFEIRSISGSSMGALIGGIYAAGRLDAYARWVKALEKMDVVRLLDFSFQRQGLIKGDKVMNALKNLIGDFDIEDLPVSFTAIATDVDHQREVWLNRGSLFEAVRASIAIPTFFTPVEFRGRLLLDGGLINPIPIAPTLKDKTDITIAVNLAARPEKLRQPKPQKKEEDEDEGSYRDRIGEFLDSLQERFAQRDEDEADLFDIINRSFDTMQATITRFQLAAYSPDVIVDIPRNACASLEFYRAAEMIELGRQRAEQVLATYVENDGT